MTELDKPLQMVVHSMPSLHPGAARGASRRTAWKLLAIVLICSLPAIVACYAYFVVRPQGQPALGELVQPARAMPGRSASTSDQPVFDLSSLKGQWLLVSVAGAACDADCRQRLHVQRQLREILGKDRERVDSVWLVSDQAPVNDPVRQAENVAFVVRLDSTTLSDWLPTAPGLTLADSLFVVDPMGNTMMRFPSRLDGAAANKAKRDLERLLRASAPWDSSGR